MSEKTGVAILGATGSIGKSTLAVIDRHADRFEVVAVTANRSGDELAGLARRYRPELAVLADPSASLPEGGAARWASGREAVLEAAVHPRAGVVVNALVGAAGLEPTVAALRAGKRVALANKESLVCGGGVVLEAAEQGGGELLPVDSEHSAALQVLSGESRGNVSRLILTASGGPFRGYPRERLEKVSPAEALRHPTWEMGAKITIDSATLANKALEVIEAHHLFGLPYDRVEAVIHPQSIIHAMVEFVDGSVLAQMGLPSMELPILYALSYPDRLGYQPPRFDPVEAGRLTFEPLRRECFPCFSLGLEAGRAGGTTPAAFNAANEVAVAAFLEGRIPFPGIPTVIEAVLDGFNAAPLSSLEAALAADGSARRGAEEALRNLQPG
ncbi:MAG: 1-deoxy-D-xylulose-5-phosphate reductoisomerase [Longimicrobiaceae bacterium]